METYLLKYLDRTKEIFVVTPPKEIKHVLILCDGQNLFDDDKKIDGKNWRVLGRSWRILENVESNIYDHVLIVGMAHDENRLDEYGPFVNKKVQYDFDWINTDVGGSADRLQKWIVTNLLVFLNSKYNYGPVKISIAGSSMGGLFALYAGLKNPDRYHSVGVFSPSLWFNRKEIFSMFPTNLPHKMYLYCGAQEGDTDLSYNYFVEDFFKLARLVEGRTNTSVNFDLQGEHNEEFWQKYLDGYVAYMIND